jgi:hypothetical protein
MLESVRWVAERVMIRAMSGLHAVSRGPLNQGKTGKKKIKIKKLQKSRSANKFADTEAVTSPCMSKLLREA